MLETVVGRLREDGPGRFHVFTYYPRDDRRLVRADDVVLHSCTPLALVAWLLPWALVFGLLRLLAGRGVLRFGPAAIRALGESRVLVDLAGVSFIDGREKFLPFNVLTLVPAILLGTPVVKLPQAVGPFRGRLNRLAAALCLPRCRMLWARGATTFAHLRESGFRNLRYAEADDIAFNHRAGYALTDEGGAEVDALLARVEQLRPGVKGVVGLCPSSVIAVQSARRGGGYEPALVSVIQGLAGEGFLVVLFPNATRAVDEVGERNNDLPLMRRLMVDGGQASHAPLILDCDANAANIKRVIAAMDLVLVSRFHAMVAALSAATPVAVIGWSHKYAEVMQRFGLDDHVMDYERLDPVQLCARAVQMFEQRAQLRGAIAAALPGVKARAERPVAALASRALGADLA